MTAGGSVELPATTSDAPPSMTPSQREAAPWRDLTSVFWIMALFLASSGVLILASKGVAFLHPSWTLAVSLLDAVVVAAFALGERQALRPLLARSGLDGRGIALTVAALAFMIVFVNAYFYALRSLHVPEVRLVDDILAAGWPVWTAFAMFSLMPAVVEEVAFRGFVWARLERVARPRDVLFIQAALFSVAHLSPMVFVSHLVIGLVLGSLRRITGSLYPGILLHAAWNALVIAEELM
jgi:membrane protease YdiL (CAAX protease family)